MHQKWQDEFRDTIPASNIIAAAAVLLILTFLGARFFVTPNPENAPVVDRGKISLAAWDFADGPIQLVGDWEFYWQEYLGADNVPPALDPIYTSIPSLWHNIEIPGKKNLDEDRGYATYRLIADGLAPGNYAFFIPILYAPSRIWINGIVASQNGALTKAPEGEVPVWKGHYVGFISEGGQVEILVEVSDHIHGNGRFIEPAVLGSSAAISDFQTLYNVQDLLIQGIATVLFIFGLVLFLFRRQDLASLYFALFSLFFGTVLSYLGINISELVIPQMDFWTKLNIFYAAETGTIILLTLYVAALYPDERFPIIEYVIYAVSVVAIAHTTFFLGLKPEMIETPLFSYYVNYFSILVALYVLITVIRACIKNRDGAWVFLIGMSILLYCVLGEIAVTNGVVTSIPAIGLGTGMTSLGFLVFLISQVIILAQRWTHTLQASERMTTDLSRLIEVTSAISSEIRLESLLQRIVHGATEFIHAERGTLYLYDDRTDELWSLVAEGLENKEIRMPADSGLAGACFQTGDTINVEDAYADKRFNRHFDEANNFRTKTILTMPVQSKGGNRIGVMQVLNKIGRRFVTLDEERLHAFAAQAAIAIENAELFGEVNQARNYNESILGSMSNGVVTINAYGDIEKVNKAALTILETEQDNLMNQPINQWLSGDNEWLAEELVAVRKEAAPRTFLDVDVANFNTTVKALNLSVIPLIGEEGEDNGILMLLEDITGEKRLRGTMSRFMTKEVADRILEQGEDTLAGSTVNASVLFLDMRNFTGLSERLGARETVAMLNEFFSDMTEAIFNWKGVLDKFIGDSIMAVFGAPLEGERDADNALASAIEMMQILRGLNRRRVDRGDVPIDVSIGIATGEVIAGTIGSAKRVDYTVVGDSVNLAARLENITRYYGADIIVSEETITEAKVSVQHRELDLIRVRGRETPSVIYQILGHHTEQTFPNMETVMYFYQEGLEAYRDRNWDRAINAFTQALSANRDDRPSSIYLDRATLFKENPPLPDWDGVWTMSEKK